MTGKQAHTAGPWFAVHNGLFWDINVKDDRHAQSIASNHANRVLGMTPDEAEANARLIAAAPDLLEACQNMKGLYDTPAERRRRGDDPFYAEAVEHLRAAISRASGESQ